MAEENLTKDERQPHSLSTQFRRTYDWSVAQPSIAVIVALAIVENADPRDFGTAFETTLYDHVNPEALDTIVTDRKRGRASVAFSMGDYRIRFDGNELVVLSRDE